MAASESSGPAGFLERANQLIASTRVNLMIPVGAVGGDCGGTGCGTCVPSASLNLLTGGIVVRVVLPRASNWDPPIILTYLSNTGDITELGAHWSHNFQRVGESAPTPTTDFITFAGGTRTRYGYHRSDTSTPYYPPTTDESFASSGTPNQFMQLGDGSWLETQPDGLAYHFPVPTRGSTTTYINYVKNLAGVRWTVMYDGGTNNIFHHPINNVSTTVGTNYTHGSHSLVVASGTGGLFQSTFPLIITASQGGSVLSILEVTGRSTDTLTISSAIEGTSDVDLAMGVTIQMRPTAMAITELQDAITAGPATNGQAVFGTNYVITANDDWQDTGLTLTLPAAGTYLLLYNVRCFFQLSGAAGWISVRLFDSTSSAVVANSARVLYFSGDGNNVLYQITAGYSILYTPTGACTISLQAYRNQGGGGTWNLCNIESDSNGYTTMLYVRLA